ncbi:MAG: head-tail connector protein [Pseudomonadota bacterium]
MAEPVTLPQAKAHCRVLSDDEDGLIAALITAAREWVENFTGHILVQREVTQRLSCFRYPRLFAWPIADDATITATYVDSDGATQTLTGARLIFGNGWTELAAAFGSTWPTSYGPATVTVEAGYPTAADVPQSMKQAILLLVAHWFANREAVSDKTMTEVPMAVEALCRPYRMVLIG